MPKHPKRRSSKPRARRPRESSPETSRLLSRVEELEQTLQAIRGGEVDALVINAAADVQVYTLQGAEHRYRVMIESICEGVATLDAEGTILYANGRLSELLGVALERLIGTPLKDNIPQKERAKLQHGSGDGVGPLATCEISVGEDVGVRRVLHISFSPFGVSGLELVCAIVSDVTQLVEANEAQRSSEEKLQALSGRLLKLQDEERRHISRDLHDVSGQNLAALNLALSELERAVMLQPNPEAQKLLNQSKSLAEQVSQEIRTLSYVLHPPLLEEVGLASAVRWYTNGFGQRTGIQVEIDTAPNVVRLSQDAEIALFRVLQESLTNVHRYSESSVVHVRLGVQDGRICLEVEDKGKGMSRDALMMRGASASLGVGIQGMRERMRQLSGTLEISSRPGAGTKVRAAVPLAGHPSEKEAAEMDAHALHATGAALNGDSPRRVLIVDDHETLREGIRRVLHKNKDWLVCGEAANGKEAVERAAKLRPDLVILDLSMPVLNGLDALKQIRQKCPETKVLIFTVNNSEHVVREISAAGADGYLCKSNAARDLLGALNALFDDDSSLHASAGQN